MTPTASGSADPGDVGAKCPSCGAECRPGFDACADCGVPLVFGPGREHERTARPTLHHGTDMPDEEFEATFQDLRARPDGFEGLYPGGPFGPLVRRVSVPLVVLFVRVEDERRARRIEARRVGVL